MLSRSILAFYAVLMNLLLLASSIASRSSSRGCGSTSSLALLVAGTTSSYWNRPAIAFTTTTIMPPRRKRKTAAASTVDDNDSSSSPSSSSRKRTTKRSSSSSSSSRRKQPKTKDNDNKEQQQQKSSNQVQGKATVGTRKTQYYLMKSEPDVFSIHDLQLKNEENWDGVRNFQARNILRTMKYGDVAYFYHSSCKVPGIVGTMKIVSETSFPDITALDRNHNGYDEKSSSLESCRWDCVRVQYQSTFEEPVTLIELKELATNGNEIIANMKLLRNSRLSVQDLTQEEYDTIQELVLQKKKKNENEEE